MHLWMSGEVQADVGDAHRSARQAVEQAVNERLKDCSLSVDFDEWAFISIILPHDHPDNPELKKKHAKRKVLEFRLKISHQDFLNADQIGRIGLLIDALKRSVDLMTEFRVSPQDRAKLTTVLNHAYRELAASKSNLS